MGGNGGGIKVLGSALLLLISAGCTYMRPVDALPHEQRDSIGRLAVAASHFAPELDVDISGGYGHGRLGEAGIGAASTMGVLQSRDPFGLLFKSALAPVSKGGAVYGASFGDSVPAVQEGAHPADARLHGTEFQRILRRNVLDIVSMCTSMAIERADLRGAASLSQAGVYRNEKSIETILEVGIRKIQLQDGGHRDSRVQLKVAGFARLVRVEDGSTLLERTYGYLSAKRDLARWAEEDAALVRTDLLAGFRQIAEKIVDDCLLTSPRLEPPVASLEAVSPEPDFCFFCEDHIEPLSTLEPELCWEPFPAPEDLTPKREWLREAEEIVYDLRVWDPVERVYTYAYGLKEPCYRPEAPLAPCRVYWWAVRARFRMSEHLHATPWFWDSRRKKFKTVCGE